MINKQITWHKLEHLKINYKQEVNTPPVERKDFFPNANWNEDTIGD